MSWVFRAMAPYLSMSSLSIAEPSTSGSHIDRLQSEVERLEAECRLANLALASAVRKQNESTLIYKLPNEVLSLIMEEAFRSQDSTPPRIDRLPFNVASVSSLWREVALSRPLLWSRIDFFLRPSSGIHVRNASFAMLMALLERSKTCPIDAHLFEPYFPLEDHNDKGLNWSIKKISDNALRCRSFTFHVRTPRDIFEYPSMDMPLLQELIMLHDGKPTDLQKEYSLLVRPPAMGPSLRTLVLSHIGLLLDETHTVLEGLRTMRLSNAFVRNIQEDDPVLSYQHEPLDLDILRKARDLEELEIECTRGLDGDDDEIPLAPRANNLLQLPNLKILSITLWPPGTMSVPRFVVPALQKLSYFSGLNEEGTNSDDPTVILDFDKFLFGWPRRQAGSSLHELCLVGCSFFASALLKFLSSTPQLRILRLGNCPVDRRVIAGLTKLAPRGTPELCPRLQSLYLRSVRPEDELIIDYEPFTYPGLLSMVQARDGAEGHHEYQITHLWINGEIVSPFQRLRALMNCVGELHVYNPWNDGSYMAYKRP